MKEGTGRLVRLTGTTSNTSTLTKDLKRERTGLAKNSRAASFPPTTL